MSTRVAINGLGRMGRLALRAAIDDPDLDLVLVNEPACGAATSAHLLEFDSIHGRWHRDPVAGGERLIIGDTVIPHTSLADPAQVPWSEHGVDLVIECSGVFKTPAALEPHLEDGRTVVVSAPVKDPAALNIVVGINDDLYDPAVHRIVTAASCTTNCLAPVVKVIHEGLGIERGSITTLHDLTNTQTIVDAPHKDLRRARACGTSLIPTTTGSATAIALIFPELQGKLNGHAVRVPLLNASLTDCVFEVARPTTVEEVNGLLRDAAEGPLAGILGFEERPLVSVDFKDDPRSSIIDALSTLVVDGTHVKIYAWYDNEWGYANRLVDLTRIVARARAAA